MSASAELIRHPVSDCNAIRRIGVEAARKRGAFSLSFRVEGEVSQLALPAAGQAKRADGLWQHSCFEAFLRADGGAGYLEFNFSPSGAWAAYRFGRRRSGRESPGLMAPSTEVRRGPDWLAMTIQFSIAALAEFPQAVPVTVGLAAVIEDRHGVLSWWALAHGADRPDFHDPLSFTLRLPA